ncbi:M48 family metallopeptidase [Marinisporobacter balticus]|uniref:YgjP-like metallopeptidase domain-containing protein n=1 Tax=Marinisporobacter balticus TaxID=2018667 RepID=A0A4R2KB25_9FIRM|nr:SprT family zinc-dependent metalloprotease [Marinisporobacter balticus]TCO70663.1 hypothetical protein EV214_12533 [Marinisporobacter balticus]
MKFEFGTQTIAFDVQYRRRKTVEIGVEPPDRITVVAPYGTADAVVLELVGGKAKWIVQKLFEMHEIEYRRLEKEYINGESFMYLGRNYSLQIVDDPWVKQPVTKLYQGKFYIHTPTRDRDKLKKSMEQWYRQKTLEKVMDRMDYYLKFFDQTPTAVNVKEQKKRWASCTAKRELYFNWRCTMAPTWVFDYIVVHELCHMVYMDHSKAFWSLVERIMPDYEKRREWLKNYGIKMDL